MTANLDRVTGSDSTIVSQSVQSQSVQSQSVQSQSVQSQDEAAYEIDYVAWIGATLKQLRDRQYVAVDWDNLIEELEDMGKRERRSLESHLIVLLLHLIKWQFQPERRSGSWQGSILEHRRRILRAVQDSPSLKPYLAEVFADCYGAAVEQAIAETGLPKTAFPATNPYDIERILESSFLPSA